MSAKLLSAGRSQPVEVLSIGDAPALIGRCDDADLLVQDRWVSRRHCELIREGDLLVVRDLGSRHGTYVNDCRVEETCLDDGDSLSVGLSTFTVRYEPCRYSCDV